jgi:hypothetical protein
VRLTAGCANELFRTEIADGQVHRCTGERGRERERESCLVRRLREKS